MKNKILPIVFLVGEIAILLGGVSGISLYAITNENVYAIVGVALLICSVYCLRAFSKKK